MSLYENNMSALHIKYPEMYLAITEKKNNYQSEGSFFVEKAKNGMPIICTKRDDKTVYLNSRYDPLREAERYALKYQHVYDYSYMVFFGFGNGQVAEYLLNQKGEHIEFLYYEPSAQMFLLTLENYDLTLLIESSRITLVVKDLSEGNIDSILPAKINAENYRISLFNTLPCYEQLYKEEIKEIYDKFEFVVANVCKNINTDVSHHDYRIYNDIYNLKGIFFCNCEEQFKGIFPVDRPAIIVSAGPSLEKNVECLMKAKGKLLIMAVDSALPFLISKGVQPDVAITVDPRKPVNLFENEEVRKMPLAVATDSNHEIVERVEGKIIYATSDCDYYNKMFDLAGRKIYQLPAGGSVATSAFALAIAWGYRKIVLVGQDLAIEPEKVHAGDVDDMDEALTTDQEDDHRFEVEGYYGGKVFTLPTFNDYREWYEFIIRNDDNLEVINATEGGAKIKGTVQMTLMEAIESCQAEPFDFEKTIREMPPLFNEENRQQIINIWKESIENITTIKQKLYQGMGQLKKGIQLLKTKQYKYSQIKRLQKNIGQIIEECDGLMEMYFLNEAVVGDHADVLGDIYIAEENDIEEVCRVFEKLLDYMKAMHGSADKVRGLFEEVVAEVECSQAK